MTHSTTPPQTINQEASALPHPLRCFGNKSGDNLYANYHDHEWGVPVHDDRKLFEMLSLEGAQAGLSWETILKRREHYRAAFFDFDVVRVAAMTDGELEAILKNPNVIRNRLKIFSVRKNAQIYLQIQQEFGSFARYLWAHTNHQPIINQWKKLSDIPASTPLSAAISKDLKKRGMSFVGPTIIYAYLQSVGVINDHLITCPWKFDSDFSTS
ncbi:MAG: DNA-3-methyladenine glycosylase I [Alphaproteobacteria bacterium]|nr:DNA-3-methyladenine glycosylase I [Alphaproteobacteria bacterium]